MKKLLIIGGIGAGKSTVCKTLAAQGMPFVDLDKIGHGLLEHREVKAELVREFGSEVMDQKGQILRTALAHKAFASEEQTHKLNEIMLPRIAKVYENYLSKFEKAGHRTVIVEYSAFTNREQSFVCDVDVIIAVLASPEIRTKRAVRAGFSVSDVQRRMARQIDDRQRRAVADVAFVNEGTRQDLRRRVIAWWRDYPCGV